MPQWFEDESFWNALYPFMFPSRRFDVAEEEAGGILNLAGVGEVTPWTSLAVRDDTQLHLRRRGSE